MGVGEPDQQDSEPAARELVRCRRAQLQVAFGRNVIEKYGVSRHS
jgi:hypothetical protein